jgi:DNA-3-methyladenine glycosylase
VTHPKLPRAFYGRDGVTVAKELLGKVLVHQDGPVRRAARIVETEAYHGPDDRASHARFGPTKRAAIMFGPPGFAYVYLVYGISHCVNVVTGDAGSPSAVLLRAAEPLEGCLHRTIGPGNLARALGVRRELHDGLDLEGGVLWVEDAGGPPARVVAAPRVGVAYAGAWAAKRWRFLVAGSAFLSAPVPAGARAPRLSPSPDPRPSASPSGSRRSARPRAPAPGPGRRRRA